MNVVYSPTTFIQIHVEESGHVYDMYIASRIFCTDRVTHKPWPVVKRHRTIGTADFSHMCKVARVGSSNFPFRIMCQHPDTKVKMLCRVGNLCHTMHVLKKCYIAVSQPTCVSHIMPLKSTQPKKGQDHSMRPTLKPQRIYNVPKREAFKKLDSKT